MCQNFEPERFLTGSLHQYVLLYCIDPTSNCQNKFLTQTNKVHGNGESKVKDIWLALMYSIYFYRFLFYLFNIQMQIVNICVKGRTS